jgi:hypothetical protein
VSEEPFTSVLILYKNTRVFRDVSWDEYKDAPVNMFPGCMDVYEDVWTWCKANCQGVWFQRLNSIPKVHEGSGRYFDFQYAKDAMLFKLAWA